MIFMRNSITRNKLFTVNIWHQWVRHDIFSYISAVGSLLPYIAVFMKQLGLTPSESAIIYGITPFLAALVRPFFGILADKLRRHTLVLILCTIITSIAAGCILLIPPVTKDVLVIEAPVEFSCRDTGAQFKYCHQTSQKDLSSCLESHVSSDNMVDINTESLGNYDISEYCVLSCDMTGVSDDICLHKSTSEPEFCSVPVSIGDDSYFHVDIHASIMSHNGSVQALDNCHYFNIISGKQNNSTFEDLWCQTNMTAVCWLDCPHQYSLNPHCDLEQGKGNKFSETFWVFAFVFFIMNIFFAPVVNLLDALTYSHLGEDRGKWGNQRVWGTIGFALFGVCAGFLMDTYKRGQGHINYTWCFILFIVHSLLAAVAAFFYKTDDVHCAGTWNKLKEILSRLEVMSLFLLLLPFGMFTGVIETFLFWHLQMLGAPQILLGLCMVVDCFPEIFIMYIMGRIIKLLGENICLYSVCFAYAARFLGYSFLSNPWWVLMIEPLHGFTYAVMYGAASSYGSRVTPTGMHGTVQAIIASLHFGIGMLY